MKHLGMIEGEPIVSQERKIMIDVWWYGPNNGGIITLKVNLLDEVKKGQVLADIRDIFNNEIVDQVVCPFDNAIICAYRDYPYTELGG